MRSPEQDVTSVGPSARFRWHFQHFVTSRGTEQNRGLRIPKPGVAGSSPAGIANLEGSRRWFRDVCVMSPLMLFLSAAYVFACAFRSFLPRADIQRICLFDTWLSSVTVGRSVATVAEICFTADARHC
jgi:hypothetical protein